LSFNFHFSLAKAQAEAMAAKAYLKGSDEAALAKFYEKLQVVHLLFFKIVLCS